MSDSNDIRTWIMLCENKKPQRIPKGVWLFHGTLLKNLTSIQKHGLSGKFTKVQPGYIHFSNDSGQAAGYFRHWSKNSRADGLLLSVNSAMLDQSKLGPDQEDLADMLDQNDSEQEWDELSWKESLELCGQCVYEGVVPPALLTVEAYNDVNVKKSLLAWQAPIIRRR